jgi:hypothetical protein
MGTSFGKAVSNQTMAIQIHVTPLLVAKVLWVGASISFLLLAIGALLSGSSIADSMDFYVPWMLGLSFPSGLVVTILLSGLGMQWNEAVPALWLVLFVAGYFQWFVVLPAVCDEGLITLGLAKSATDKKSEPLPTVQTPREITPAQTAPEPAHRVRRPRRKRSFAAFDQKGRTPLQRALDHLS